MDEMERSVALAGENSASLELSEFAEWAPGIVRATVLVRADWYSATVTFLFSTDRLRAFREDIGMVLKSGSGASGFINDDGNVELKIEMSKLGHVSVSGILIKRMDEDARVEFSLNTDRHSLEVFHDGMRKALGQ